MGGKPNKALYFVGHQGQNLLFLDPHYVQKAIPERDSKKFETSSYTCQIPKTLDMRQMDPGLGIGFYLKTYQDFSNLKTYLKSMKNKYKDFNIVRIK